MVDRLAGHRERGPFPTGAAGLELEDGPGERIGGQHGPAEERRGEEGAEGLEGFAAGEGHGEVYSDFGGEGGGGLQSGESG